MKITKYIAVLLCNTIFRFAIYALTLSLTFVLLFGNSSTIKSALIQTNAYQDFVQSVITANAKDQPAGSSLPLNDPTVQGVIKKSFPPGVLQNDSETVIDSFYDWLNGVTAQPQFTVDFQPSISALASGLSDYAVGRLQQLPVCKVQPTTLNPFTDKCRPAYFSTLAVQSYLETSIENDHSLLPKTKFTANDLPHNTQGQTFAQQYNYAPKVFRAALYSPSILGVIATLTGAGIVLTSWKRRQGVNRLAKSIIGSSIFIVLSPAILLYVLPHVLHGVLAQSVSTSSQSAINNVVSQLNIDFNKHLIVVGLALTILGFIILFVEKATRPVSKYVKVTKKSGILSSNETPRPHTTKGKRKLSDLPLQTSEGEKLTSKYQKDKRYRKIPKDEI